MYPTVWYRRPWTVAGLVLGIIVIIGLVMFAKQTLTYIAAIKRGEDPGVGLAMRASVAKAWRDENSVAVTSSEKLTALALRVKGLESDPYLGPAASDDEIVIFQDFGCPYCRINDSIPHDIYRLRPDIKVSIRDFPLTELHPDSLNAARAARCIWQNNQDLYWSFSDMLYAEQGSQDAYSLRSYASRLGADMDKFDACVKSADIDKQIGASITSGQSAGVRATPTYFVNGKKLEGAYPLDSILKALNP